MKPVAPQSTRTILAFSARESREHFQFVQRDDGLILTGKILSEKNPRKIAWVDIEHSIQPDKLTLVTITSGQRIAIYIEDALVVTRGLRFIRSNFMGHLVLGTSPTFDEGWTGELRGLAFYDQELTQEQVARHYRAWKNGQPELSQAIHFYRFDERAGDVIHDAGSAAIDLHIPTRYTIVQSDFLDSPWHGFRNNWGYWKDVLVNIAGFVPFGFLFAVYFSSVKTVTHPRLAAVLFGTAVTLFIEITQAWLPTRDSSMTDVLTNILGTALGAVLQSSEPIRSVYNWVVTVGRSRAG
jgi:hypothetical protein